MAVQLLPFEQPLELDFGASSPDWASIIQPGVLGAVASTGITATVNSGTGALTFLQQRTNDSIWFTLASGLRIRGTLPAMTSLTAIKPTTVGNFRYIAIDAVPPSLPGSACTLTVNEAGSDQTTAALAASNPTTVAAGNVRLWDGIVQNSASTFVLIGGGSGATLIPAATGRDRCPWARGVADGIFRAAGATNYTTASTSHAVIDATNLSLRLECSGGPIEFMMAMLGNHSVASGRYALSMFVDGAQVDSAAWEARGISGTTGGNGVGVASVFESYSIAAGSHLFQPSFRVIDAGTLTLNAGSSQGFLFQVRERLQPNVGNGTA